MFGGVQGPLRRERHICFQQNGEVEGSVFEALLFSGLFMNPPIFYFLRKEKRIRALLSFWAGIVREL
jgi:hypothetical protein